MSGAPVRTGHSAYQDLVLLLELDGKLKIVKVEAAPNPGLVEKYKVAGHSCVAST